MLSVLLVIFSAFLSLFLFIRKRFNYWKDRGVPYAEPSFPLGTIPTSRSKLSNNELNSLLWNTYKGKSPFVGLFFATKPAVLLTDLALIKRVLITDFANFHDKGLFYDDEKDPISGHIFNVGGEKWKKLRQKLSPTFTSGKMKLMFPLIVKICRELVRVLQEETRISSEIEMKEMLSRCTTDVIANCAFGLECCSLRDPEVEFRRMGKLNFEKPVNSRTKMVVLMSFRGLGRIFKPKTVRDDVAEFFTRIVHDTVNYREKNDVHRTDFMDLLIKMKNSSKPEEQLTMNEITAQAFLFFMAGHETSSTTMSNVLLELAQNEEIQQKARRSVREAMKRHNGEITYESVMEMEYLELCLSESLRKYPPATSTMRLASNDFEYQGKVIEKGTTVVTSFYAIHRDPDFFPDPERFIPERFLPEEVAKRQSLTYIPFGEGPRICLGMRFGQMQARIGLAMLLDNFEFTLSPKMQLPLKFATIGLVMQAVGGMHFNVKAIK